MRLKGRVQSDTGSPVANAVVTAEKGGTVRARALSGRDGAFVLELPDTGDYLLNAFAPGYFGVERHPVAAAQEGTDLAIVLTPVREFSESVDVTAPPASLALDQTASEQVLTGARMQDIPVPVSHDLKATMRMAPGVVQDNNRGIHLNGGAENQTLYLVDGFNVGDPLTGNFDTRLALEGIQSMNVVTGTLAAEYGKGAAGAVAVTMKSGDDRVRYSATNFIPGLENNKGLRVGSWYPRVNISGPVVRGRVWFSDSFAAQYAQTIIRELAPGADKTTSIRYHNFLHVQANWTPSNILTFGFLATLWTADRTGLSALDPPPTTVTRRARQWFFYGKNQHYFGRGAMLEAGLASNRTYTRELPQGTGVYIFTPFGRAGNYFVNGRRESSRDQGVVNGFLPPFHWLGSHQAKAGTSADWLSYDQQVSRTGYEWLDADLSLVRRVLFRGNGDIGRRNLESAAYLQDSWRPRENVLVEIGLRADWDRLVGQTSAAPRIGAAWSPMRRENTRLSAGYSVAYDATPLALFARPLDQSMLTYLYPPYGSPDAPLESRFVAAGGLSRQRFSSWNAALSQRLAWQVILNVEASLRRGSRGLTYRGVAAPGEYQYRLGNTRADSYNGLSVSLRQNFRREYGWMASYTRSRARSTAVIDLASDTPLMIANNAGRMEWDAPNRFLGWGYIPLPVRGFAIAAAGEYHTGFPFSIENSAGAVLGAVNSRRFPAFFELDVHIEKRFQFRGQRWAGRAGFNNITAHNNPNVVNNIVEAPQFLTLFGGQARALQFRIRWLGKLGGDTP